jgi:hypothetical protein
MRARSLAAVTVLFLAACVTVRVKEDQFFDPRPASLSDSVRRSAFC